MRQVFKIIDSWPKALRKRVDKEKHQRVEERSKRVLTPDIVQEVLSSEIFRKATKMVRISTENQNILFPQRVE